MKDSIVDSYSMLIDWLSERLHILIGTALGIEEM